MIMFNRVVFDETKVNSITDRLLPLPGKILSGKKRDELFLSLTSEITGLLVPIDQKEASYSLSSINDRLDAVLPPARSILSKATRADLQTQISAVVRAEISTHNNKLESDERAVQAREAVKKKPLDLDGYEEEEERGPPSGMVAVVMAAAIITIVGISALVMYFR